MGGVFRRRQPIFLGTIDIAFLGQVCATGATPDGIWLGLLALRGMCAEAPMPPNLNGIRVVVVEDHGDSREILEAMLLPLRQMRTSSSPTSRCHLVKMACGSWSK
jgi:hypothetical protein